jgi:hypothetical protein
MKAVRSMKNVMKAKRSSKNKEARKKAMKVERRGAARRRHEGGRP